MYNLFADFRYSFIGTYIVSFPPLILGGGGGGISFLTFGQRGGSWKNCSEIGELVEIKILLLMAFISIFISLKTSNFLENKSHPTRQQDAVAMSWRRLSVRPSDVAGMSQMKYPTTSRRHVVKTFRWYVSMTSYWNVVTTSQEDVTTTSHQCVSSTTQNVSNETPNKVLVVRHQDVSPQ